KATADFSPPRDAKSERAQKGPRSDHRSPEDARNSGAKVLLPGRNEPHSWVGPAAAMGTSLNEPIGRNSPRARSSANHSPAFLAAAKSATRGDSTQTAPKGSRHGVGESPKPRWSRRASSRPSGEKANISVSVSAMISSRPSPSRSPAASAAVHWERSAK